MSLKRKKSISTTTASSPSVFEQVYQLVLKIPVGRVMTYRQISLLLDERLSAAGVSDNRGLHAT